MTSVQAPGDELDEYIQRYCNWGRWGRADERGTANLITPQSVRDAARAVELGRVVSLNLAFDQNGPQTGAGGRINPLRFSTSTGSDHSIGAQRRDGAPYPREVGFADDAVMLHLQCATHWDALSHVFHRGKMYNGFPAAEVTSKGAPRCGIESVGGQIAGRAVLLDVARSKGLPSLADGYAVTAADLEGAADLQGVQVREGDVLLIRTGHMGRCLSTGWGSYAGGDAPGLSLRTIPWLHERGIAAVASDTWGVEVRPNELPDSFQPFHIAAVVYLGILLGEIFYLEELAEACAEAGRYEVFLSAPPLPFVGAAGAPPGAVAIL